MHLLPAHAGLAPLWRGFAGRAAAAEEEGESCAHSNILAKSTFFSRLQTQALIII